MVTRGRAAGGAGRRRPGEAGYNLVVLVMAIALLNIMVAAMLPLWSTQIRREKEEELIFRGMQYAEAIRLFQKRYQRLPTTLKELVDVQPRCIRQLWKDPMTEDGKWAIIYQGQGVPLVPGLGGQPGAQPGFGGTPTGSADVRPGSGTPGNAAGTGQPNGVDPATGQPAETVAAGPIVGVHSRSTRKSIETWNGQQEYDQWNFTFNLLTLRPSVPGNPPPLSARWIGRPFPGLAQLPGFQPVGAVPVPGAPGVGAPGRIGAPGGFGANPGGLPGGAPPPSPRQ